MTQIEIVADKIKKAKHLVVFTGAGVSVESGIPTFRGNGGVYNDLDMSHLQLEKYKAKPAECFKTIKKLFSKTGDKAEPNDGHKIIGKWESEGIVKSVITQNVDNLHQEGGSKIVYELHGNGKDLVCLSCGNIDHFEGLVEIDYPKCSICGKTSKPGFTFFGEQLPTEPLSKSIEEVEKCDVMIIIGCSGEVYPAAGLPMKAKTNNAFIIEINPNISHYTGRIADITLSGKSGDILVKLDELIKK